MKKLIIDGNTKMGDQVAIFNLPPKKTCTPSKWCLTGRDGKPMCYALRNNFLFKNVVKSMDDRYQESLKSDFVDRMIKEIKGHKNLKYFRIHASGDFYSKEYIRKWIKIAQECQDVLFRATTRRKDLKKELVKLNALSNVIIRQSLDTENIKPTMSLPFAAISSLLVAKGAMKCSNSCPKCKYSCWKKKVNVCFDEH